MAVAGELRYPQLVQRSVVGGRVGKMSRQASRERRGRQAAQDDGRTREEMEWEKIREEMRGM